LTLDQVVHDQIGGRQLLTGLDRNLAGDVLHTSTDPELIAPALDDHR
jgi:hypothetical protein